jgi:hypothetical protein
LNESLAQTMFDTGNESDAGFESTVLGGRLHWWPKGHLDLVLTTTRERKVRTTEELEAAIKRIRWAWPQLETSGFTRAWRMGRGGSESRGKRRATKLKGIAVETVPRISFATR